ncbi:MAG: pyridoxamine 5'-phosphate oxidase family protein [Halococcoides sp.]
MFDRVRRIWRALRDAEDTPESGAAIVLSPGHATSPEEEGGLDQIAVDPHDLTGVSIAFSKFLDEYDDPSDRLAMGFLGLEHALSYHEPDLVYRFLDSILATATQRGCDAHAHMDPDAIDDQARKLLSSLFASPASDGRSESPESGDRSASPASGGEATPQSIASTSAPPAPAPSAADEPPGAASHSGNVPFDPESLQHTATMSDDEIDDFLDSQGHGVVSFDGSPPYAIPMSYGYDPDDRVAYLHLSEWDGNEKARRLDESDRVSLVVSRFETPSEWSSVVVDGHLTVADDAIDFDRIFRVYNKADVTTIDVFGKPIDEIDVRWFVLEPIEMAGRQSSIPIGSG